MITLITFLGWVPKGENGYRTTVYEFPDGSRTGSVAFFGWPLQERLQAERLVILGTAGSMWDHLFEGDLDLGNEAEATRLKLVEAVEGKAVGEDHLRPLAPLLAAKLGCDVRLALIPEARDEPGQVALLRTLAGQVRRGDTVHLDVTHGFRHLPMLALLAALHLRLVKDADIGGIWYGSFDPDSGKAQVLELSGLLHLADWLQALAVYDRNGDYGVFAPLLGESGKALRQAAFYERTTNPVKAREKLAGWKDRIDGNPAYDLFRDDLHHRIGWWKQGRRPQWEAELARRYLTHGDWLRAAIYGLEAVKSLRIAAEGGNLNDYGDRTRAAEALRAESEAFRLLTQLRNAMAHGVRSRNAKVLDYLTDAQRLSGALQRLFDDLLPEP
ncbi:hypothetical protein MIN45_P1304 [Methylomarinovum tepidoasis]|uniref:TIGR02221 family CRISPR-associated protein n=1 Tax=Methylomarinovum tepidoasis TaxID=2840183 RepID=A0AAU9CY14_9GAMM|nr:TIGR02221 family CRISPR-associated protein [Methylomarinovum sp. IN45]BCX88934.1 hypothetical protein MIN45_P1304 [Methylomarinovum sp. IN45]